MYYLFRRFTFFILWSSATNFVSLHDLLLVSLYLLFPYYPENLFFCVAIPAFVSFIFWYFCIIFFLCSTQRSIFLDSFHFSFSHTFVTFSFLISIFRNLTSIFLLSVTKSKAYGLLSSSDSSCTFCSFILSTSSCSFLIYLMLSLFFDH